MQEEKKSFIKKNYKKVLAAAGVITIVGVSYVVCKKFSGLKTDNHTLMAACSEGLFDEAIATTTRKLNYRQDKLLYIERRLETNPGDMVAVNTRENLKSEIDELTHRLKLFGDAQKVYKIEETIDQVAYYSDYIMKRTRYTQKAMFVVD